jgi:hypothetical protein
MCACSFRLGKFLAAAIVIGCVASTALGQTIDPRYVQFSASADHFSKLATGQPVVSGYQMLWYAIGASTPVAVFDLGKPDPDSTGAIVLALTAQMTAAAVQGITYQALIAAVGPSGSAASTSSNAFVFPCSYDVFPTTVTTPSTGGTNLLTLTTSSACAWSASSWSAWLTIDPAAMTGSASLKLSIAPNATTQSRTGAVSVAGTAVTIIESAAPTCTYTLNTTRLLFSSFASTSYVTVTTGDSCIWKASASTNWLSVTPTSGTGIAKVMVSAKRNTDGPRAGAVTIGGVTVSVNQDAKAVGRGKSGD